MNLLEEDRNEFGESFGFTMSVSFRDFCQKRLLTLGH